MEGGWTSSSKLAGGYGSARHQLEGLDSSQKWLCSDWKGVDGGLAGGYGWESGRLPEARRVAGKAGRETSEMNSTTVGRENAVI